LSSAATSEMARMRSACVTKPACCATITSSGVGGPRGSASLAPPPAIQGIGDFNRDFDRLLTIH
jgi:hypothetical protein